MKAGYFAVTRKWLLYGCPETPEEMAEFAEKLILNGVKALE